ncbi:hypothetical protein GNI_099270 [Gregarina niphandrodes]|uniref:Uncharacterized protein n=1 Tax=Gregarina niphandrodes TaxID=110365 RepID=A0A023B4Y2_GRENI|nr:hypothetical protein GNI_099270 [Gregarina niphandrodes]EZG57140.1 hypothetical protein GNI_099270 [Gregarina niphandrodes]|eukprot:XP_011131099.1 hypothetical protein GNI_099270 [Gregarina niphandrodes]
MGFLSTKDILNFRRTANKREKESAFQDYFDKLELAKERKDAFNPTIVQTTEEFDDMLNDMVTRAPITIRTVHLPAGYTMQDPRLRGKTFPVIRSFVESLPAGELPVLPAKSMVADIKRSLVPPAWNPINATQEDQRIQVILPEYEPVAEYNGDVLLEQGKEDVLPEPMEEPTFSPAEIQEASLPHRRLSADVDATYKAFVEALRRQRLD